MEDGKIKVGAEPTKFKGVDNKTARAFGSMSDLTGKFERDWATEITEATEEARLTASPPTAVGGKN